jgi:hypothetical protein
VTVRRAVNPRKQKGTVRQTRPGAWDQFVRDYSVSTREPVTALDKLPDRFEFFLIPWAVEHDQRARQLSHASQRMKLAPSVINDRVCQIEREHEMQAAVGRAVKMGELCPGHEGLAGSAHQCLLEMKRPRVRQRHVTTASVHAFKGDHALPQLLLQ